MYHIHSTFPASPVPLIEWCTYLANTEGLPCETIEAYLMAVTLAHIDRGISNLGAFKHLILRNLIHGIKRVQLIGGEASAGLDREHMKGFAVEQDTSIL